MGTLDLVWQGVLRLSRPVTVPAGSSLTILPGTRIVIDRESRAGLVIQGILRAEGGPSRGQEIIFFPEADWDGVVFAGASSGDLRHVRLEGGPAETMACLDQARVRLRSVRFLQGATGLRCAGSSRVALSSSAISDHSGIGILAQETCRLSVEKSSFARNATSIASKGSSRVELDSCCIQGGWECGVNVMESSALRATRNRFEGNHTAASVRDDGSGEICENEFRSNKVGVHGKGRAQVNLWRNRFHGGEATHDLDLIEDATISARPVLETAEAAP